MCLCEVKKQGIKTLGEGESQFCQYVCSNAPSSNSHPHFPHSNLLTKIKIWALQFSEKGFRNENQFGKWCCLAAVRCGKMQADKFDHAYYMRRCVELARKASGCTSPNPMVGCVIVKDGKIVGEGFHPKAGQPHAEVFALRDAGDLAENGTSYVSLEPCNHYGRTPPCSEALINARVNNVVVGMVDPNPIVASTGVKKLQDTGIEVTVGVEEELCKTLNEAYIHYMLTRKPYVTLRYSMSLDGHLLDQLSEEAVVCGGYYSKLLQEYDATVVPSAALAKKSSIPISKEPGANQPLKIVLSKCWNQVTEIPTLEDDGASKLLIVTEKDTGDKQETAQGVETLSLEKIRLLEILEHYKNQGLCSVLLDLRGNIVDFGDILKEVSTEIGGRGAAIFGRQS